MITIFSTTQGYGGGAEAVLCEMLEAWPYNGLSLQISAPRGSRVLTCAESHGFALLTLDCRQDTLMSNAKALYKVLKDGHEISLAHAWSARALEFAWWIKRQMSVPASGTLHDHPHAMFHGRMRRMIIKYCANRLDMLAVVSEAVSSAVRTDKWSVPVSIIRNGLVNRPKPTTNSASLIKIGFLGMQADGKGPNIVADWISQKGPGEGVAWKLYGAPCPQAQRIFRPLAARWPDKVFIEGQRDSMGIFSDIDILVHASTQFDALPTVLIEAARAGIPCVASCAGGADEIVQDCVSGFLFDPSQPALGWEYLARLISDPSLRMAMGCAARKCYEARFHVNRMAQDYHEFWNLLTHSNAANK